VTKVIRSKASNLDKSWNSILNQSNIKGWNWKKNQLYKRIKKIAIKIMKIKIKTQNKF